MFSHEYSISLILHAALFTLSIYAGAARAASDFNMERSTNLAVYWGQNDNEPGLTDVCQNDSYDTVILAFVSEFPTGSGSMRYNFGNQCANDNLDSCAQLKAGVKACHSSGKIVTVSIGDSDSSVVLSSDAEAEKFGQMIYQTFLGGNGTHRPFDDMILDGVDLDIEHGTTTHFPAFVNTMRDHAKENRDSRKYYLTAAPQCIFPDEHLGYVLNRVSFDAVYVQFYNNEDLCGLQVAKYGSKTFNFKAWNDWALNTSPNHDVKIYIGAPASPHAGDYYVNPAQLGELIHAARHNASFGGVMLWDAGSARSNDDYDKKIKKFLTDDD